MRAVILILLALCGAARADDEVEAFYRGRSVDMVIGVSAGGGYDLYARLVAQFMGEHIPGRPRIVSRNMAGAGSRTAAGYVAAIAPRDGSVLATASQSLPLEQALGSQQKFDVLKFIYIGADCCAALIIRMRRYAGGDAAFKYFGPLWSWS